MSHVKYFSITILPDTSPETVRAQILSALRGGTVQSFGSRRLIDAQLRKLKGEGLIAFTPKSRGGNGWSLVASA